MKKTLWWQTGPREDAQCFSIEKYKSNLQWGSIIVSPHSSQNGHNQKSTDVNAREGVEKGEPSYTVGGNVNCYSRFEEQYESSFHKLKLEVPYDSATSLLDIYLKRLKTLIWKDTFTPVFLAAVFIIAKIQNQPKCPSTEYWIKAMVCPYTTEYYSAIKKTEIEQGVCISEAYMNYNYNTRK